MRYLFLNWHAMLWVVNTARIVWMLITIDLLFNVDIYSRRHYFINGTICGMYIKASYSRQLVAYLSSQYAKCLAKELPFLEYWAWNLCDGWFTLAHFTKRFGVPRCHIWNNFVLSRLCRLMNYLLTIVREMINELLNYQLMTWWTMRTCVLWKN